MTPLLRSIQGNENSNLTKRFLQKGERSNPMALAKEALQAKEFVGKPSPLGALNQV